MSGSDVPARQKSCSHHGRALLDLSPDSRVLVINSEGDTDPAIYREIVGAS